MKFPPVTVHPFFIAHTQPMYPHHHSAKRTRVSPEGPKAAVNRQKQSPPTPPPPSTQKSPPPKPATTSLKSEKRWAAML